MATNGTQVLQIEPHKDLVFEGPFTEIITAYIKLTNPLDNAVGFKVKTTVPKSYCVRPSNGYVEPHQSVDVAVMLQPFSYSAAEKFNHKFMIQSIIVPDGPRPTTEQLWKDAPRDKLMDSRLFCVLRMPGELIVEPTRDLVFEGPFGNSIESSVKLTNPSTDFICYKIQSSNPECFSASPSCGLLKPNGNAHVTVTFQSADYDFTAKTREKILIHSVVSSENADPKLEQTYKDGQTTDYLLKCVFKTLGVEEKVEVAKQSFTSASIPTVSPTDKINYEALISELNALRKENATLKESDICERRKVVHEPCWMPSEPNPGVQPLAVGIFSNIPPILYLTLALLVGLFIGRFIL